MAEQFRVVFRGQIAAGQELSQVKANLQRLTGFDPAKIDELFARPETVLKGNLDQATAGRYLAAIQATGALCAVEPMPERPTDSAPAAPSAPPPVPAANKVRETVCPKCGLRQPEGDTCAGCGIVYAKYNAILERQEQAPLPPQATEAGKSPLAVAGMALMLVIIGFSLWWVNFPKSAPLPEKAIVNQKHRFAYRAPADWLTITPENYAQVIAEVGNMLPANFKNLLQNRHPGFIATHLRPPKGESDFSTNFNIIVVDTKGRNMPRLTESEKENATETIVKQLKNQIGNYNLVDSRTVEVDGQRSLQITGDAEVTFTISPAQPIYETSRYGGRIYKGQSEAVHQRVKLKLIQTMIPGSKRAYVLTYTGISDGPDNLEQLNRQLLDDFRVTEQPPRFGSIALGAINGGLVGAGGYLIFVLISAFGNRRKDS